ncbi:hypothetical protein OC835_006678, partial [Tilletia horrida]
AIINICPHYYDLAEVMGDRISTNPRSSHSTTSKVDRAGSLLRGTTVGLDDDDAEQEEDTFSEDDDAKEMAAETIAPEGEKEVKVEDGTRKVKASDTGRKFGKANTTTPTKRKISAVEAALAERTKKKTSMEEARNESHIRKERIETLMALARDIRAADDSLSYDEAIKQAKLIYENL